MNLQKTVLLTGVDSEMETDLHKFHNFFQNNVHYLVQVYYLKCTMTESKSDLHALLMRCNIFSIACVQSEGFLLPVLKCIQTLNPFERFASLQLFYLDFLFEVKHTRYENIWNIFSFKCNNKSWGNVW